MHMHHDHTASKAARHHRMAGLTLLELLVVLTILIVLSTVAITSTSAVADQARYEATQRTLENIRDAVIGPDNLRDTDGTLLYTGFVADTGRLPGALSELVTKPDGMAAYQVLSAIENNIVVEPPLVAEDEQDPDVKLGVGWRGPYLRLPPGNLLLQDGWREDFVVEDNPVRIISHGRDRAVGPVFGPGVAIYDSDSQVEFLASVFTSSLTVQVEFRDATTWEYKAPGEAMNVVVRLFGPDPVFGKIRVHKSDTKTTPSPAVITKFEFDFPSSLALTIGPHAIRAYYNNGAIRSSVAYRMLRPGLNPPLIPLVIAIP